jgi:hypothetical protein
VIFLELQLLLQLSTSWSTYIFLSCVLPQSSFQGADPVNVASGISIMLFLIISYSDIFVTLYSSGSHSIKAIIVKIWADHHKVDIH